MTEYRVLEVSYCNLFEGLSLRSNLDVENKSVQVWYPMLWKHKEPFIFSLIQDRFLKEFIFMLTREAPIRIIQEAEDFLKGKEVCVQQEDHTYIRPYGYEGSPFLLLIFFCDRYFVAKVYRQYKENSILFTELINPKRCSRHGK
jgi:hypothetical protein